MRTHYDIFDCPHRNGVSALERGDDIIGFDVIAAGAAETESGGADLDIPAIPARKNSRQRQLSSPDRGPACAAENNKLKPDKKKSFISEWQKDLREFFSLGRKAKTNRGEWSRASCSGPTAEAEPATIETTRCRASSRKNKY